MVPIFQVAACGTNRQTLRSEYLIMPSLVRFLTVIAIAAAAIYAGLYSLAHFVPNIGQRIHYVILVVIFLSLLPAIISIVRARHAEQLPAASTATTPEKP